MSGSRIEGRVIPTLPARDVDETVSFYERLGFTLTARYEGEQTYFIVERDEVELHFYNFPVDPKENLSGFYLRIRDADALYEEWLGAGITMLEQIQDRDYGLRDFVLADPNGNLLRVGTPLPVT